MDSVTDWTYSSVLSGIKSLGKAMGDFEEAVVDCESMTDDMNAL